MRITICYDNYDLINTFVREGKAAGFDINLAKFEPLLFQTIEEGTSDAYILFESDFSQKATDFIKKSNPYIPVVTIKNHKNSFIADSSDIDVIYAEEVPLIFFVKTCFHNIAMYLKTFEKLRVITSTVGGTIFFGKCSYDPTKRMLCCSGEKVKKLSVKEGGILEVLAINFGTTVMKGIILEKVWHKTDYFTGRSMDVYVTHLRNTFRKSDINMHIKNISGIGLVLEEI